MNVNLGSASEMETTRLLEENYDLRRRLEEDEMAYRRKLDAYHLAQQHQATLVSRLQSKVLQYKKRCQDLEARANDNLSLYEPSKTCRGVEGSSLNVTHHLEEPIVDLESALRTLNDEKARTEKLSKLNATLREQLEESHKTNESLTNDLQKLALEWQQMRDEMVRKEEEWKEEEQFFDEYFHTEHNRMANLWQDVKRMKRNFAEIQSATQQDLSNLRSEVNSISNDMMATCNSVLTSSAQKSIAEKEQRVKKEMYDLQSQLNKFKSEYEDSLNLINQKDNKIQQISNEIQELNKKIFEANEGMDKKCDLKEEIKILINGLNEIAHTMLYDIDMKDSEIIQSLPHFHLTSMIAASNRQPSDGVTTLHAAAAVTENTISAVQAVLYKYQLQVHELQMKISSLSEQLISVSKQYESQTEAQRKLSDKINDQNDELDSLRSEINLLSQEKESLIKALDLARSEKSVADKNQNEMSAMLESVNTDYEKTLKNNNRIQKIALDLENEKNFLENEVERLTKELETRELNMRMLEDRCSQMLDEMLTVKEDMNKESMEKEIAEQNRIEAQTSLNRVEKLKGELQMELQRVLKEQIESRDALVKVEAINCNLEENKKQLLEAFEQIIEEKNKYQNQLIECTNDLTAVRKELLHTEQNRLDLESQKMTLIEKCEYLEIERSKMGTQLNCLRQECTNLKEQLTNVERKKDGLNEELMRLRHRIEQVGDTNARVNKHMEDLVQDCEEKQVMLESNEREICKLQELNTVLKRDKESLESMLLETQNNLAALEMRSETMDGDIKDLLNCRSSYKNEISKLENELESMQKQFADSKANFTRQMKTLEIEYKQKLENLKLENHEKCLQLEQEREQIREYLEKRMQTAVFELGTEKTNEIAQLEKKLEGMKQHVDMQNQQYEEVLRRAESDKQQALLLAHQDQKALLEKLEAIRGELSDERTSFEKLKREANSKAEQDRTTINNLRDQTTRLTSKIEDMRIRMGEEKQKLEEEIKYLHKECDNSVRQCEELKVELTLVDTRFEDVKLQLNDANNKLKEVEKEANHLTRALNDGKRQLNESNLEKEKYSVSNRDLREFIKKSEAEKREQARSLEEAHQKITGLLEKLSQLENEKSRLEKICKEVELKMLQSNQMSQTLQQDLEKSNAVKLQQQNDEKALLTKLNIEMEEKEKLLQELHVYKKQLLDTEKHIEVVEQEIMKLRSKIREDDDKWRTREQGLLIQLDESRSKERMLEDQAHEVELRLNEMNQQVVELKSKLGGSDGRVRALDGQVSQLEDAKKDLENRLVAIGHIFKRLSIIQQEGLISSESFRMLIPSRRSPSRAAVSVFNSRRAGDAYDVDPENIKKAIQIMLQQITHLEKERNDSNIQIVNLKKQLDETFEVQNKNESKINSMVQCIRQLNEEKGALKLQLDQIEITLSNDSDLMKRKLEENRHLKEKISGLESSMQNNMEEKQQTEEKLVKLRTTNAQLEGDRQKLRDELSRCESRSAKLEIQRIAMEGDLNRLQMMLQEKDDQIQKMQERLENQTQIIAGLESKCDSLQSSVELLNSSVDMANSVEADLRGEIQSLQRSLSECAFSSHSTNDRIKQLQKTLNINENEKRLLAERLQQVDRALIDIRDKCRNQVEQIRDLQSELDSKDIQRMHLEDQLRFAKMVTPLTLAPEGSEKTVAKMQIECCELRGRIEMMEEKLRRVETEKKNLEMKLNEERAKSRGNLESTDTLHGSTALASCLDANFAYMEHENKGLKQRCNQLEAQISEKETELARLRREFMSRNSGKRSDEMERFRAGQLRAEHLLKAREQSHRQQVQHLKNEITNLRKRLDQEMKLKRRYLLESPTECIRMRQLRDALTDSLRTVSQNPTLDALLLDHETKKLNSSLHMVKAGNIK